MAQLTTSISPLRRQLKRALIATGVACLALALARPLVGFRWEEAKRKGLDLLFAVDASRSMLAQDVKPDRLTRAKMAVEDFLAKMDGDRVGLIAFAGNAFLQCPLTLDHDAFRQSLDAIDTKIIPRGGTDIAAAIHEAEAALAGNGNHEHILILLTDGEDLEGSALTAARAAAKNGLRIFTVGVGGAGGELIPFIDERGGTEFVKDGSGQFVKSHLDESMLKQIAEATGAMYQPLGQQGQGLEAIYQKGLAQFARHELTSRMNKVYIERFQWPLALGLLCLVLEPLIGLRKRQTIQTAARATQPALFASWNKRARPAQAVAATALAMALLTTTTPAHASVRSGEKAFQQADYAKAEQDYRQAVTKNPGKPVLQFNHGAAAYKAGNFDAAAQSFANAMKTEDLKLQQDDYYNLGNTQYRIGQKTEKANAQETIKTWENAVQSYEAALQLKSDDVDAKYNRDLVKKKIEELKKQQQQQQQQQNSQKNQDKKQQNQQDQDSQSKNDSQPNQDQNKQNNKQQQNQPNDGQGQPDKQDQKNDKDRQASPPKQDQRQPDQKPESGSGQQQHQPDQNKDQPDQQNSGGAQPDKPEGQRDQEPQKQNSQANQKPEPTKKEGQPQARNPQPTESAQDQAGSQREPGKMSREEAKQLLDSLKSGDRKMPLEPSTRGNAGARNDEALKDW